MAEPALLEIRDLSKRFPAGKTGLFWGEESYVRAVDGVNLSLGKGEILGLVGESGCGKSTLALTLIGLEPPSGGSIYFNGQDITRLKGEELKAIRRKIQMIFQDPYESLNPTQTILEIIREPLIVHRIAQDGDECSARVKKALEDSGLKPAESFLHRYPHELSGGQRQRVVIAGALVLDPLLLLADEPVSMLDVSIRAEILNLLLEIRQHRGISVLFITHDLGMVSYFADRVAVMYLGRVVEVGLTSEVLTGPLHPYTKALLSVVPVPNPRLRRERIILQGETPNPIDVPPGCSFHPRCPISERRCAEVDPSLREIVPSHSVACLLVSGKG